MKNETNEKMIYEGNGEIWSSFRQLMLKGKLKMEKHAEYVLFP